MAMPAEIREIWAWIVIADDGSEGIPATNAIMEGHMIPLLGADEARVRSLQPYAEAVAAISHCGLKLMRFERGIIVETRR
jgi:hypothetical protein